MATIIRDLVGDMGENQMTNVEHEAHFINGANLELFPRALNQALAFQLATFPTGSSSGGYTAPRRPTWRLP